MNYIQKYMKRTLASFFMGKFALKMNLIVCQQIRMRVDTN